METASTALSEGLWGLVLRGKGGEVAGTLTYRRLAAYMRSNFPAQRGNGKKHI